jgi:hypothetical protein
MRRRTALIAAGISAVILAAGGVAYAAASSVVDSAGVIHGCYSNAELNGSHALVVQDTTIACPKGTTALN